MKRKTGFLACIMLVFCVISFVIVKIAGTSKVNTSVSSNDKDETVILTSFYPMYVLTLNLVDGVDGVKVINLTENQTGCVHDYQLTTKDMREIAEADIAILNGGEMEEFMEEVINNYPELQVINASEGMNFLKGISHDHSHDEDSEEIHTEQEHEVETEEVHEDHAHEDHDHEEQDLEEHDREDHNHENQDHEDHNHEEPEHEDHVQEEHDHDHHLHSDINGHVWMNMDLYEQQINTVAAYLSQYDTGNATIYKKNAEAYIGKVKELKQEFADVRELADGKEIVIFHDAFAYLAQQLNMEVVSVVETDSESALSAGELAEVIEEIKLHNIQYLFTEAQYSTLVANRVASETNAKVYVMDSLVTGKADKDAYLNGMRSNLEMLKEALK
ncbi:MAG: metal ABC transporter substrate-binding protein [Clostridiales bacterium]|nr:metal ABC transporter substrate-binding protein [Clostridiales bacterium]